jgi:hypothetical protein
MTMSLLETVLGTFDVSCGISQHATAMCVTSLRVQIAHRGPADIDLRQRLRALAHERRGFGYRRVHLLGG